MRLVCDTNVLIAAIVADGLCRDIVKQRLPNHDLFTSDVLLSELDEKLRNKFGVDAKSLPLITSYQNKVLVLQPAALPASVCRDRDDDEVLAAAVTAGATAIITGDKDLLMLKTYSGIPILSPRQFVESLDQT